MPTARIAASVVEHVPAPCSRHWGKNLTLLHAEADRVVRLLSVALVPVRIALRHSREPRRCLGPSAAFFLPSSLPAYAPILPQVHPSMMPGFRSKQVLLSLRSMEATSRRQIAVLQRLGHVRHVPLGLLGSCRAGAAAPRVASWCQKGAVGGCITPQSASWRPQLTSIAVGWSINQQKPTAMEL